jgi:amino-acid N-acetyltransferase
MVKERRTELVEGFRHSVPYINAHRGKTFVIMLGGEAIEHENFSSIVNDIGLLHSLGIRLVVVYGARPQIDANLAEHHHEPVYHKQTRVTDAKTLELVKQAAGMLQLEITASVDEPEQHPLQGAHINVVSGNFIIAQPLGVDDGVDYCHSGRIRRIDEEAIHRQLDNGAIVLMGPVAVSVTGESFNLTSEEIATQLAVKLKAEKDDRLFCSSQGVYNQDGVIVSELFPNEAQARKSWKRTKITTPARCVFCAVP